MFNTIICGNFIRCFNFFYMFLSILLLIIKVLYLYLVLILSTQKASRPHGPDAGGGDFHKQPPIDYE